MRNQKLQPGGRPNRKPSVGRHHAQPSREKFGLEFGSLHNRTQDKSQKPQQTSQDSAVRDDVQRTASGLAVPWAASFDFSEISRCHHANRRLILESLEIKERKPALNENKGFSGYVFTD